MDLDLNLEHCDDLQHLLANGVLEQGTWACAIAVQTINFGLASLTDSQRSIYEAVITPALEQLGKIRGRSDRCLAVAMRKVSSQPRF